MKATIQEQLVASTRKLKNLQEKIDQIKEKTESLEIELGKVRKAYDEELNLMISIGVKKPSGDVAKANDPEDLRKREEYNKKLQDEKVSFVREATSRKDFEIPESAYDAFMKAASLSAK